MVRKYCGLTTLPHSGVSLIYTTVSVGVAQFISPQASEIMALAIPVAALINEVIALILSKKAYEWAGEINLSEKDKNIKNSILN